MTSRHNKGRSRPEASSRLVEISRRGFLQAGALAGLGRIGRLQAGPQADSGLELAGRQIRIRVRRDLGLRILDRDGQPVWSTSTRKKPEAVWVSSGSGEEKRVAFQAAGRRHSEPFSDGAHRGYLIRLSRFPQSDLEVELVLALDPDSDELLIEVRQEGGSDRLKRVDHLYCLEKPTSAGGYLVVPHGSGYLIPADSARKLGPLDDYFAQPGALGGNTRRSRNIIGYRYTLPVFGMVNQNRDCLYQIVETWWDCSVAVEHLPGERSTLDFNWLPSLGRLAYPRRSLMRFARGMDHVGIAKSYRTYAKARGLLRTLEEKAEEVPALRRYIDGIEYRILWQAEADRKSLRDLREFRQRDLPVNFFFPKWGTGEYDPGRGEPWNATASWQAFMLEKNPIPGGWERLVRLSRAARVEGALVKVMINPTQYAPGAPSYDPAKRALDEAGKPRRWPQISPYFAPELTRQALDSLLARGFQLDALYFDGYAAHAGVPEDHSSSHPLPRRLAIQRMLESFREARRRGIIAGAELPRFWAMAECDYFFFRSGWSSEILGVGEPIPLFQLVFHECYAGCFSGGGYGRYDWPRDRQPRLYELLFGAAPAYNWMLPYSDVHPGAAFTEVPVADWDNPRMEVRLEWLKRWRAFYRAVAWSEMVSHRFLNTERTLQQVAYANGVKADFDLANGLCRVQGVSGFSGEWEKPHRGQL